MRRRILLLLAVLATLLLAACGPEADRELGDGRGSGADIGNRDEEVEMHGDEPLLDRIYYQTPLREIGEADDIDEDDDEVED